MNSNLIFFPVLAQIVLTLYVFILLAAAKKKAVRDGEVNEARRSLHDDAWPSSVQKINNNIRNQFEIPILFYVLCVVLWASNGVSIVSLIVASLFVVTRCFHVYVHTGSNFVPLRRKVYTVGFALVIVLLFLCFASLVTMQ